jgi:hypothetical protein
LQHVTDLFDRENATVQSRPVAHFWLAKFHAALGDRVRAKREYEIALALDPSFPAAKHALDNLTDTP